MIYILLALALLHFGVSPLATALITGTTYLIIKKLI
jgi:hypothetical protein